MIIKTVQEEIQNYLSDASNYKGYCEAVYFPENKYDIINILKDANKLNKKVTVSGNGTGLTGARVPEGGIVISTERLNKIVDINTKLGYAIVEPAVSLSDFLNELKSTGYFYPPDPTEKNCFIGGTVATNASGAKTFKYGATRNYVEELEIILPTGDVISLRRGQYISNNYTLKLFTDNGKPITLSLPRFTLPVTKNASGYYTSENADAVDLFIGSEGTLGIFTKIKLKILPLPEKVISAVFFFNYEQDALQFIEEAREKSFDSRKNKSTHEIDALALESFDNNSLRFLKSDYPNIPDQAASAVWMEQETDTANEEILLEKWTAFIKLHNGNDESVWFAANDKERERISEFRHAVSAKVNEYISQNNFKKLGTDVAVPADIFISFYNEIKNKAQQSNLDFLIYGHFGNSHIHLNILPKNQDEYKTGRKLYLEICDKAVSLKGTISAEHGIGKLKREYLTRMLGDDVIDQMREIKHVLDPNFILCAGNIFSV